MPVFSHIFSLLWKFTFPIFWELCVNALHEICKRPVAFECLCFPRRSSTMRIQISHGIVWVSITREIEECGICKKPKPLEYLCFPIIFLC